MTNSYKLRARPNLFDLSIMEGYLNGGGTKPAVQREAYWAEAGPLDDIELLVPPERPADLDE